MDLLIAPFSFFLLAVLLQLLVAFTYKKNGSKSKLLLEEIPSFKKEEEESVPKYNHPTGPFSFPIIGNLIHMVTFRNNPFKGLTEMAKTYGSVFKLQLGSTPCVVVSSFEAIKEVLIQKGNIFDQRPDFLRWNAYFDGDRQQSLALCDWSDIQKVRRNVVRSFLHLKQNTDKFSVLDSTVSIEMTHLINAIDETKGKPCKAKIPISYCALNVFLQYLCSTRYDYDNEEFKEVTKNFDFIFEDINNGHLTDFLPWLAPMFKSYKSKISSVAKNIRNFILKDIIKNRPDTLDPENLKDLVDVLLSNYMNYDEKKLCLDWEVILFALEDLLGGSSAVSNMVMRILAYIDTNDEVQKKIQNEIDTIIGSGRMPELEDKSKMPYSEAVIWEALRLTSSPIVPHVASEDSTIQDLYVQKGTVIMLNNYSLNNSPEYWNEPEKFLPERFIVNNQIKKPSHFLPFSTGKRSCVGSRILMSVTFSTITTLLQKYTVSIPKNETVTIPKGRLSLVGDGFHLTFKDRTN